MINNDNHDKKQEKWNKKMLCIITGTLAITILFLNGCSKTELSNSGKSDQNNGNLKETGLISDATERLGITRINDKVELSTEEKEKLVEAIDEYLNSGEKKTIKMISKADKDQVWELLADRILGVSQNYSANSIYVIANGCKELYEKAYSESRTELNQAVALSKQLKMLEQSKNNLKGTYPFDLEEGANNYQYGSFYITQRLETSYGDNFLGKILDEVNSYIPEEDSCWVAYNVVYDMFLGQIRGDNVYILYSSEPNPFTQAGVHNVTYFSDGKTMETKDSKGFQNNVPVLYLIDENSLESDWKEYQNLKLQETEVRSELLEVCGEETVDLSEITSVSWVEANAFEGEWADIYNQRCHLYIAPVYENAYHIIVEWGNSGWDSTRWEMTGIYDSNSGILVYSDCISSEIHYNEDGTETKKENYTGGKGKFYFNDGYMHWQNDTESIGNGSNFEKQENATMENLNDNFVISPDTPYYSDEGDAFMEPHVFIENSSITYLSDSDIYWMTPEQLRYAINEIYARHGRRFKNSELQAWFDAQDWYNGTIEPDNFDESVLSDIERENIKTFQHRRDVNSQ